MQKKTIWEMGRDTVEQFRAKEKMPVAVVLDNVRSLNNIGSIFRTSDAFRVAEVVLCGIAATPPSPEIHKTALRRRGVGVMAIFRRHHRSRGNPAA